MPQTCSTGSGADPMTGSCLLRPLCTFFDPPATSQEALELVTQTDMFHHETPLLLIASLHSPFTLPTRRTDLQSNYRNRDRQLTGGFALCSASPTIFASQRSAHVSRSRQRVHFTCSLQLDIACGPSISNAFGEFNRRLPGFTLPTSFLLH